MPKMGTRIITAFADFIIRSVWFRLKLFSKCSFDLELRSVDASGENEET